MAHPEHHDIARRGAAAVNLWVQRHPGEPLDLRGADLSDVPLGRTDLSRADLHGATLKNADLSGARLPGADLGEADLTRANLTRADLTWANLMGATLIAANLTEARLGYAFLATCNLTEAVLAGAVLTYTNFHGASLTRANVAGSLFGATVLASTDLSSCTGLDSASHLAPSAVSMDTLATTLKAAGERVAADILTFLRGTGVEGAVLQAFSALATHLRYHNCYIVHVASDRPFAERLYRDLWELGINSWLCPLDEVMALGFTGKRREADRAVVVCSEEALARAPVRKEIEELIDDDSRRVIPVSMDDRWKEAIFQVVGPVRDLKPFLMERCIAEFRPDATYPKALGRLVQELHRPQPQAAEAKP